MTRKEQEERKTLEKLEKLKVIELTPKRELIERHETLKQAAKKNGVTSKELYRICRSLTETLHGHIFMAY